MARGLREPLQFDRRRRAQRNHVGALRQLRRPCGPRVGTGGRFRLLRYPLVDGQGPFDARHDLIHKDRTAVENPVLHVVRENPSHRTRSSAVGQVVEPVAFPDPDRSHGGSHGSFQVAQPLPFRGGQSRRFGSIEQPVRPFHVGIDPVSDVHGIAQLGQQALRHVVFAHIHQPPHLPAFGGLQ